MARDRSSQPPRGDDAGGAAGPSNQLNRIATVYRQTFIQALMKDGYMSEEDAKSMLRRIAGTSDGAADLPSSQLAAPLPASLCVPGVLSGGG